MGSPDGGCASALGECICRLYIYRVDLKLALVLYLRPGNIACFYLFVVATVICLLFFSSSSSIIYSRAYGCWKNVLLFWDKRTKQRIIYASAAREIERRFCYRFCFERRSITPCTDARVYPNDSTLGWLYNLFFSSYTNRNCCCVLRLSTSIYERESNCSVYTINRYMFCECRVFTCICHKNTWIYLYSRHGDFIKSCVRDLPSAERTEQYCNQANNKKQ